MTLKENSTDSEDTIPFIPPRFDSLSSKSSIYRKMERQQACTVPLDVAQGCFQATIHGFSPRNLEVMDGACSCFSVPKRTSKFCLPYHKGYCSDLPVLGKLHAAIQMLFFKQLSTGTQRKIRIFCGLCLLRRVEGLQATFSNEINSCHSIWHRTGRYN